MNERMCIIRMIYYNHNAVTWGALGHIANPLWKKLSIMVNMWSCLIEGVWIEIGSTDPTLDDKIIRMSEIGPHQTY